MQLKPFYILSQLIIAQVMAHKRELQTTKDLYDTLDYVCSLLEQWNAEQFKEEKQNANGKD
jgi:hypothetical protein